MTGGMYGRGHSWQGDAWQGGMHDRRCAWQGVCMAAGCVAGDMHNREACVARETATTADGTHPTGMHSCLLVK